MLIFLLKVGKERNYDPKSLKGKLFVEKGETVTFRFDTFEKINTKRGREFSYLGFGQKLILRPRPLL